MVTAAHCLYNDDELVSAKSLSVLLGLHDRSKKSEPKRCYEMISLPNCYFFSRKQILVDEIFVHENYSTSGDKANDIALLRLGTNIPIVEPNVALLFDGMFLSPRGPLVLPLVGPVRPSRPVPR